MTSKIIIICFDINNDILKDNKDNNILILENPIRILDEFQEMHLFFESEKTQKNSTEIKYTFSVNILKNIQIIYEIVILRDINFIHDISLVSDANLIFINLEKESTIEQLDKIIHYINDSCCSFEIKTYVVGIYKDKIIPVLNKETIESLFDEQKFNCDFYQIKYNKSDGINHLCMYEQIESKNKKKKNIQQNLNGNIIDIVEKILIDLYEIKMSVIYEPKKKKFKKKSTKKDEGKNNCISGSNCNIF